MFRFNIEADTDPFGTSVQEDFDEKPVVHAGSTTSPVRVVLRSNLPSTRRAGVNADNRRGIVADSPTAEKWSYKRMSRSFDNHESIEAAFRGAMADEEEEQSKDSQEEAIQKQAMIPTEKIQRYLNVSFFI